jgi:hypothetical protein
MPQRGWGAFFDDRGAKSALKSFASSIPNASRASEPVTPFRARLPGGMAARLTNGESKPS